MGRREGSCSGRKVMHGLAQCQRPWPQNIPHAGNHPSARALHLAPTNRIAAHPRSARTAAAPLGHPRAAAIAVRPANLSHPVLATTTRHHPSAIVPVPRRARPAEQPSPPPPKTASHPAAPPTGRYPPPIARPPTARRPATTIQWRPTAAHAETPADSEQQEVDNVQRPWPHHAMGCGQKKTRTPVARPAGSTGAWRPILRYA